MRSAAVLLLLLLAAAPDATGGERDARARAAALRAEGEAAAAAGDDGRAAYLAEREVGARAEAGDDVALAEAWRRVGLARERLGDAEAALAALRRAQEVSARAGDRAGEAAALSHMGNLRFARGAYAAALALHERALERLSGPRDDAAIAATLTNLATIHQRLGDPERALACQDRAMAILEAAGEHRKAAEALGNLGGIYWSLGEAERAAQVLDRARRHAEEAGDQAGLAQALENLGHLHADAGQDALALGCLERALALRQASRDRAGAADATASLGLAHARFGRHEQAIQLLRAALAEAEVLGDNDLVVRCCWGMAAARWLAGEPAQASALARRAVEALPTTLAGLCDAQGVACREARSGVFEVGARAAWATGSVDAVFYFLESGRAGALLEALGGRDALRGVVLPARLREAEHRARAAEARALAAYRAALDGGDLREVRARKGEFDAARARVHDAIDRIQRESKAAADLVYPRAARLDEVRASLEDGVAIVEYGFVGDRALAVVATAEDARVVSLGPARAVVDACADLGAEAPSGAPTEPVAALRALVVDPLALPASVRRVLVSPDGPLAQTPFALLLEGRDVGYVPSFTTWRLLLQDRDRSGKDVLALGDPDYETDGVGANRLARMSSGVGFVPLPRSGEEATAVGDVVLLRGDATEAGLRWTLSRRDRWRAVHLACHGLVDERRPLLSALALTPSGDDDGFLTALEVFGMRIPADMAVLSACRTGRGRVARAEGVVGFVRAFLFAGAPRVVVSLWNGDDAATRRLMEEFHARWKRGTATVAALRESQEVVRAQSGWEHPYYWAGWCAWGLAD